MKITEIKIRNIISKILKEEKKKPIDLKKIGSINKTKKEDGIGGEAYLKYKLINSSKKYNTYIALDSDGVIYYALGSGKFEPMDNLNALISVTDFIISRFPNSEFVNKVKGEMIKRKKQADAAVGTKFKVQLGEKIVTFRSIPQPQVAEKAKELVGIIGGKKDSTSIGRKLIYNNIHVPTHEKLGGNININIKDGDWSGKFKNYYLKSGSPAYLSGGEHGAWSAWFLNACYVLSNGDDDVNSIKKHAEIRSAKGCCYPNVIANTNRKNIEKSPDSYKGQNVFVIFSAEELGAKNNSGSLNLPHLVPGDASIVNQGSGTKSWDSIRKEIKNVTGKTHMNVYLGDGSYAGGNLGDTALIGGTANDPAAGFMKLVQVIDVQTVSGDEIVADAGI